MSKNATTHMSISDKKKYKQQKLDEVAGMFSASSDSLTVKDVSVDLKIPVESARKYVRELFKSGLVCVAKTKGNTHSYKWADGNVVVTEEKEEKAFETPGNEFEPDEFIPSKVDDQSVKDTLSKFRKASDIQKKELSDSKEKIRNLQVDLNNLRIKMGYKDDTIRQLIEERDVLSNHVKEAVAEKKAIESKYALVSKLPTTVHSDTESKITIARLEERNKCLTDANSLLEKIIFKLTD